MDSRCSTCDFELQELSLNLTLSASHRSIYCPVCGTLVVENAEFPGVFYDSQRGTFVIWNLEIHRPTGQIVAQQRMGNLELSITGTPLNPYDLCYPQILIFQHQNEIILPYTGLRPEFYRYLNPRAQPSGYLENRYLVFHLPLLGDYSVTVRRRVLVSQTEFSPQSGRYTKGTALNIWPKFRRQGWRDYFVYFASSDSNVTLEHLKLSGESGEHAEFRGPTARGEIDFIPEFIEIMIRDSLGAEYWSSYKLEFRDIERIPPPAGNIDNNDLIPILALDFGTSNTCFAIKYSAGSTTEVVSFHDQTKRLIEGFYVEDNISVPWFPEIQTELQNPTQIPSEISFYKETESIAAEIRTLLPIVHYTIPAFTRYREGEEKFIQGEFKWERSLPEVFAPFTDDLQYLYLILAFRIALAEIISDVRCQRLDQIDLVATCPLAFDERQRNRFRATIGRVQENLLQKNGVNLVLQKMYDESHAGEAGSGQAPGTMETIYVDVGGGTTDVGLFCFDSDGSTAIERAIYLDSVLYAGDDIWNSITGSDLSDWGLTKLEREARASGSAAIFEDNNLQPFRRQRKNLDKAKESLRRFINGLVEYTARMIAAREHTRTEKEPLEGKLGLYLLGNGWRFVEPLIEDDAEHDVGKAIANLVAKLVHGRLERYLPSSPALTVIYPLAKDRSPKTAVALGAAILYVGEKAGHMRPEPEFSLKSFLGSDLAIFTPVKQVISWYEDIPHILPSGTHVTSLNYQRREQFDFEREEINGQRLNEINLLDSSILTRHEGQPCLSRNVFGLYLEKWQKQYLTDR
jgi:hypothetical protein